MGRKSIELIGTFEEVLYTGEKTSIYAFKDLSFGEYPVKIRSKREFFGKVELGPLYKLDIDVSGYKKRRDNDRVTFQASLDVYQAEALRPTAEEY